MEIRDVCKFPDIILNIILNNVLAKVRITFPYSHIKKGHLSSCFHIIGKCHKETIDSLCNLRNFLRSILLNDFFPGFINETSPKGFSASKCDEGYFLGESFRRIFWEEFFGRIFLEVYCWRMFS